MELAGRPLPPGVSRTQSRKAASPTLGPSPSLEPDHRLRPPPRAGRLPTAGTVMGTSLWAREARPPGPGL